MRSTHPKFCNTLVASFLIGLGFLGFLQVSPTTAQDENELKYLEVKIVDPEGQAMTDIEVEVSIDGASFPMPVDDEGYLGFNVPSTGVRLLLKVQHEGYTAVGARWNKEDTIPDEFTIPLEKGNTIGGIVEDENGQPIEGATIEGSIIYNSYVNGSEGKGELRPMLSGEIATTDAEGKWKFSGVSEREVEFRLEINHPDYIAENGFYIRSEKVREELRSLTNKYVLKKGAVLRGRVLSPEGEPVAEANLLLGQYRYSSSNLEATTDDKGEFLIANAPVGQNTLTVTSKKFSPELMSVNVARDMKPLDIQLKAGNTIRIQVVNSAGEPVEGVTIAPQNWRGSDTIGDSNDRRQTDAAGLWQWDGAPEDPIVYSVSRDGYLSMSEHNSKHLTTFSPREEPHQLTINPTVKVIGNVVDKETGLPIKEFKYAYGVWWNKSYQRYLLQTGSEKQGRDGKFEFELGSNCTKFLIRIDAEGYRFALSRPILPNESEVEIDFQLEEGTGPSGWVRFVDGRPAEGLEVCLATPDHQVSIQNGRVENRYGLTSATCDAEGGFSFPFADDNFILVCTHKDGWSEVDQDQLKESQVITLQPWARVEGTIGNDIPFSPGEEINLSEPRSYDPNQPNVYWSYKAEINADRSFQFDQVKAGTATISRMIGYAPVSGRMRSRAYSHSLPVELIAGNTTQAQLGGSGRKVIGQLKLPDDFKGDISWKMGIVQLSMKRNNSKKSDKKSDSATKQPVRQYAGNINSDGSFEIPAVLPGEYRVSVTLYPNHIPINGSWTPLGRLNQEISVPEGDDSFDLGEQVITISSNSNQ